MAVGRSGICEWRLKEAMAESGVYGVDGVSGNPQLRGEMWVTNWRPGALCWAYEWCRMSSAPTGEAGADVGLQSGLVSQRSTALSGSSP